MLPPGPGHALDPNICSESEVLVHAALGLGGEYNHSVMLPVRGPLPRGLPRQAPLRQRSRREAAM